MNSIFVRKGFTLIELLLVLILLSVLAVLSIPNFGETYRQWRLKETSDQVSYAMRYAQSRAVSKNTAHRLELSEDYKNFWISQEIPQALEAEESEEKVFKRLASHWGKTFTIPEDISLQSTKSYVEFFPDGRIEKVRLDICLKGRCLVVSTSQQRGTITVYESQDENN